MCALPSPLPEPVYVAIHSACLAELGILTALSSCSASLARLLRDADHLVWKQAFSLSSQGAFLSCSATHLVDSWRHLLLDRTPCRSAVRVLTDEDLKVHDRMDWAALVAVIGPFASGKTSLVRRLVRQQAPQRGNGWRPPPLGTGLRACVAEAFGSRGRLRFLEVDELSLPALLSASSHALHKADAVVLVFDPSGGPAAAAEAMRMLASVEAVRTGRPEGRRPCLLAISKSDASARRFRGARGAARALELEAAVEAVGCEVVPVSAVDGSGSRELMQLLCWNLLMRSNVRRERLEACNHKILHTTAGAMEPSEILRAILRRTTADAEMHEA